MLDIQGKVNDNGEGGLLSCAVDPGFPAQPYVYLGSIANGGGSNGQKRVSRYTVDLNQEVVVGGSEVVLLGDCAKGQQWCLPQESEFLGHEKGSIFGYFED